GTWQSSHGVVSEELVRRKLPAAGVAFKRRDRAGWRRAERPAWAGDRVGGPLTASTVSCPFQAYALLRRVPEREHAFQHGPDGAGSQLEPRLHSCHDRRGRGTR